MRGSAILEIEGSLVRNQLMHCVVSLNKTRYPLLSIDPTKQVDPVSTEKLLTGT